MNSRAIRKAFLPSCIGGLVALCAFALVAGRERLSNLEASPAAAALAAPSTHVQASSSDGSKARPAQAPAGARARKLVAVAPPQPPSVPGAPGLAGMIVAVDPETGELGMPSPEQMRSIGARMAEIQRVSSDGFIEIHRPDGAVGLELGGRLQSYEMVWIGPDGKLSLRCVTSDPAAAAAAGTPAPALEER
jgi:hypothetical protein